MRSGPGHRRQSAVAAALRRIGGPTRGEAPPSSASRAELWRCRRARAAGDAQRRNHVTGKPYPHNVAIAPPSIGLPETRRTRAGGLPRRHEDDAGRRARAATARTTGSCIWVREVGPPHARRPARRLCGAQLTIIWTRQGPRLRVTRATCAARFVRFGEELVLGGGCRARGTPGGWWPAAAGAFFGWPCQRTGSRRAEGDVGRAARGGHEARRTPAAPSSSATWSRCC